MKILLINKFYSRRGGAERCLFDQERWLRRAGHDVHVFSQRGPQTEPSVDEPGFVDGVAFDQGPFAALSGLGRLFWSTSVKRRLTAVIERHRPELAILHNVYHHLGPVVPLTLRAAGVPSVLLMHDHKAACPAYAAWREGARCTACRGQRFYRAAQHGCGGSRARGLVLAAESYWQWNVVQGYAQIGGFWAPSQYMRETMREMGFPFPVELLRNAVEAPSRPLQPLAARHFVGFSGRLSSEKGVDVLVRAAARLPELAFRIAGSGPVRAQLEALARELGARNVTFLGQLGPREMETEIANWRLAVVPSLSPENAPFAALDAMNHGVPVVGSAVGGMPELLAGCGVLCAPGEVEQLVESMAGLYADLDRLESLAESSRRFIDAECRPERYVARLLTLAKQAKI